MESRKTQILKMLRENPSSISGQDICEQLGISRTAVWKYMKQLKEEGYEIQAVQNKGYRLVESPDVLGSSEVESRLTTRWAGRPTIFFEETDSTNTQAKRLAEEGAASGTLVISDSQIRGKGRRGRSWESPKGTAVYMTLLLRPQIRPDRASMLTLVMGLSVVQAIRNTLGIETGIKWPNDIVWEKKKIVGILTEMSAQIDYIDYLVIGVGINVNTEAFPEELEDKAASLHQAVGHQVSRAELIAEIMKVFENNYEVFLETQDLTGMLEEYQKVLVNRQQPVRVLEPGNEYSGIARGINPRGELLVEKEDGTVQAVYAGEVSVRGLYSYV